MIISQTPLRVSLLGGGTDFPQYYREQGGCVLSSAIDKYIYVIIKARYDHQIRVGYTKTELVDEVDQVEHEIVRETLRLTGIRNRVEISTMGDIPSEGSGLGSSSTVTVGLLNAMYTYVGNSQNAETLARDACRVELEALGKPIGVQDQYIAAYGGMRFIEFRKDGTIHVEPLSLEADAMRRLNQNFLLFFTGVTRQASTILGEQVRNIPDRLQILEEMKKLAAEGKSSLLAGEMDCLGELLHRGWLLKREMATNVSNPYLDNLYETAYRAGALGGKITGAGGGGYLLLYCPQDKQDDVRCALHGLTELAFNFERDGSKIIFNYRR